MSRRAALVQGSFWAAAQTALRVAIGLVSVPLTIGYLGSERYGLLMTALSVNAFLNFLDAGLTPTLLNRLSEAHGKSDGDAFRRYASAGMGLGAVIFSACAALAAVALFLPWQRLLHIHEAAAVGEAPGLFAVLVLSYGAGAGLWIVEGVFAARLQVVKPRVYAVGGALVSFGLLLAGVHVRAGLPLLALLTATTTALYRLPLLAELLLREPGLLGARWPEFGQVVRELLPVSTLYVGIQVSSVVMTSLPNLVLAREVSLSEVASFSVAMRAMTIPLSVVTGLVPVIWPAFTVAWSRGELPWLRRGLWRLSQATCALLALYVLAMAMVGPSLIRFWTHGQADVPPVLLAALGLWLVTQALVHWLSTFLHSITDFRFELFCFAASALLTFALAVPLTRARGPAGLAVALAAALAVGSLAPMAVRARRKLSLS